MLSLASSDLEVLLVAQLKDSVLRESLSAHFVSVLFFLLSVRSYQSPSVVNSMSCVFFGHCLRPNPSSRSSTPFLPMRQSRDCSSRESGLSASS